MDYICLDNESGSGIDIDNYSIAVDHSFGDGADQTHTALGSGCVDKAGNAAGSITVSDIDVDGTPPTVNVPTDITLDATGPDGAVATFSVSAADIINGSLTPTCTAASGSIFALGTTSVTCSANDEAGNTSSASFNITVEDTTPPKITFDGPLPNWNDWYNTLPLNLSWTCSDIVGVVSTSTSEALLSEGADQSITSICEDTSGNTALDTRIINLDVTSPEISGSQTPVANSHGWSKTDVTASYECSDALSGVASLTPDQIITTEGAGQSSNGTCTDRAGNSASAMVGDINIDKTPPAVQIITPADGVDYILNAMVISIYVCEDALSGVGVCDGTARYGSLLDTSTLGEHPFSVASSDLAGNMTSQSSSYHVIFGIQLMTPLTDKSIKAGSTMSLRWQYIDADGSTLDSENADPEILTSTGNCQSQSEPLIPGDDAGNSGMRYDSDSKTWHFNLKTEKGLYTSLNIWLRSNETGQLNFLGCIAMK